MNRLKCVLGINVPCRIPSSTSIIIENHTKEICKEHSSEIDLRPLLTTSRFFSSRTRRFNDFRSFHYTGSSRNEMIYAPHRNKLKPDLISLKRTPLGRNYPVESVQRRRNSTYQSRRSSIIKNHFVQTNLKTLGTVKDRRSSKIYEKHETASFLEKEPRTYAQMIASYSQTMYTETGSGILKDGLSTAMINGVHRSPFSTSSAVALKWKDRSKGVRNGCLRVTNPNTLKQEAKFSSDTSTMTYECRNDRKNFIMGDLQESSKLERASSSYATIIERYSNELELDDWGNSLVPKRNVPMNLNDFPMMMMNTTDRSMKFSSDKNESTKKNQTDWNAKVEDVIKDLKKITAKNKMVDSKSSEKWALQSVNEHAEWMDRVVSAHKKGKLKTGDSNESKSSTMVAAANENRGSKSNPLSSYINRGSMGSTTTSSSQAPTSTATGSAKQPQIELRMTPSQNESVVSINVDELATKTAGTSAKEQLSVIISSNNAKPDTSTSNLRSNFDSMQISISENTVPVKQLEFSINGKPVSELKSIVARANKLDVFSSMDKVEIRIPQAENTASKEQTNATRAGTHPSQVLNLQIAAKFNEPRSQQPKDTGIKTSTTVTPSSVPSPSSTPPKTTPTPTQVPPHKPPRMQNFASKTENETVKIMKSPGDVTTIRKIDDLPLKDDREKVGTLSAAESEDAALQKSRAEVPSNTRQPPSMNDNSIPRTSNDERIPSNIIPWWSSEDSFRKIKKKGDTPKNVSAFDDKLMKKVAGDGAKEKYDQTYKPGGQFIDLVNVQKIETPAKDLTTKDLFPKEKKNPSDVGSFQKTEPPVKDSVTKPVFKVNEGSINSSDQNFRVVRVRSPRKSAPVKRGNSARASKQLNRVKKMRYRVKRPRTIRAVNKEAEEPIISAVRSPKLIKYVPVNPKRIFANEKSETKEIAAVPKNEEASKAGTKVEKVAEDASPAGKTNVQGSNTVFKTTKDLKKPANESADISATSSAAKEQGKRDESRRDLSTKRESVEEEPDERIKQILKSLKPIEKRKDGTLIDYGVVLPSRKPSTKLGQVPKSRSISKFDIKKETLDQEKVVEAQKVFSTKKKILTEPKSEPQVNIVEPEEIFSVRKPIEMTDSEKKYAKNELSASKGKKETREEKSVILVKKNNLQKHGTPKPMESKKNSSVTSFSDKNQSQKVKTTQTGGILLNKSSNSSSKINNSATSNSFEPKKVSSENRINSSKVTAPGGEGSKSSLKPENKEKPLKGTFSAQSSKAFRKSSDINITNVSQSQSFDKPKNITTSLEKKDSKNIKSGSQGKVKLKESLSVPSSKVSIKVSDTNTTNVSKSQSPKNITTSAGKKDSKIQKLESQEKTKLERPPSGRPFKVPIKVSNTNITNVSKSQSLDKPKNINTSPEKKDSKITKPEFQGKTKLGPFPVQPFKISIKGSDTNITNVSKSQSPDKLKNITKSSEKQDSIITKSKPEAKTKLEPLPVQSSNVPIKTSDTNITNSSKLKLLNEPTRAQSAEKRESKSTLKSVVQEKVPLEETVPSSRGPDKKAARTDPLPLMGTIVSPSPQKSSDRGTKNDGKSLGEINVQREKKVINTEMAPLEGTINNESTKKLDNPTSLDSTIKYKKTLSEVIKQRKKELGAKSSTNSSSSTSGGSSVPNGPTNPPTGPAGLRSSRTFTVSQVCSKTTFSCIAKESNRIEEEMKCNGLPNQEDNYEIKLYSNETDNERPEKDMLYSSWLQRFKNKLRDDKMA